MKILQFGSSDFLRGFVDWMVQVANEKTAFNAAISVVDGDSVPGSYTLVLRGIREEEFIHQQFHVDVVRRSVNPHADFDAFLEEAHNADLQFILSNASEHDSLFSDTDGSVGAVASSFSGKLTQLLYNRYQGRRDNPILVLPTGRHYHNGTLLKQEVLKYSSHWNLPSAFNTWLSMHITFCNTIVDRVVSTVQTGPETIKFSGSDEVVVEGEWFHQWVIEGPRWIEEMLPLKKAGLNVIYTDNLEPFHMRRARILGAAAVCLGCIGSQAHMQSIREAIEHPVIGRYLKRMLYDDLITVLPGDIHELERYAEQVIDRLRNPALGISLDNLVADGFQRFDQGIIPAFVAHAERSGLVPDRLIFALASFIYFYRWPNEHGSHQAAKFISDAWRNCQGDPEAVTTEVVRNPAWGDALVAVPGLAEKISSFLHLISKSGVVEGLKSF